MASATVLLLLLAGSLLMGSKPDEGARFDYTLCKERLCFVNSGCSTITGKQLLPISVDWTAEIYKQYLSDNVPYTEGMSCKIVLAIWPYFQHKWRVMIETKFDAPNGVNLELIDENSAKKLKIVSCEKSGGSVVVTKKSSNYEIETIGGSHGADHFNCEFVLLTTSDFMLPLSPPSDNVVLRYDTGKMDVATVWYSRFTGYIQTYSGLCKPETIKFEPSKPGLGFAPVNSDRFALTCPQDYDLMYDDGAKIHKVSMIKCVSSGKEDNLGIIQHNYQITPLYGVGDVVSIPYNQEFKAHCAPPCN